MQKFFQSKLGLFTILTLSSVSGFTYPLLRFSKRIINRDWGLFNSNSLFIHSMFKNQGILPLQNPYILGGMDVAANPQSRVFSPFVIFDLIFSAPFANLFSLICVSILGCYGMFYLLKYLKISRTVCIISSILFVHGSWFHLHFSEGHIIFGGFLLFPWIIYAILNIEKSKFKMLFAVLSACMLLDGGIYAFIYSQMLLMFMLLFKVNNLSYRKLLVSCVQNKWTTLLSFIAFVGISSFKLIPLLMTHSGRVPVVENSNLNLLSIIHGFFNPFAFLRLEVEGTNFMNFIHFHELGAYIGLISFGIIVYFLIKHWNRLLVGYILIIFFFLWVGSGWFDPINPWRLFQKIPILNNAHVQSRALFIVFCFLSILLAMGLDKIKLQKRMLFYFLAIFLLIEAQWISTYPYYKVYNLADSSMPTEDFPKSINNKTILQTVHAPISSSWGFDFVHYNTKDLGTKWFMDPTAESTNQFVKSVIDENYLGEVYFLYGEGVVQLKEYISGKIVLHCSMRKNDIIQLNSNYLKGWSANSTKCTVYKKDGLITIDALENFNGDLILKYQPTYFWWCASLTIIGLLSIINSLFWKEQDIQNVENRD